MAKPDPDFKGLHKEFSLFGKRSSCKELEGFSVLNGAAAEE